MRVSTKAVCAGLLLAALGWTTAASEAQAQGPTVEVFDGTRHRLQGAFSFYTTSGDLLGGTGSLSVLVPSFAYRARVIAPEGQREGLFVDVDLDWRGIASFGSVSTILGDEESSFFRMANPMIGGRAGWRGEHWYARGGVGLTLPMTNLYEEETSLFGGLVLNAGYLGSAGIFGFHSPWLSLPQNMTFALRGDGAFRDRWFYAGAALDMAFMFSTPREGDPGSDIFFFQFAAYGAFRPIEELGLGVRLQLVYSETMNRCGGTFEPGCSDEGYASMVIPFVRLELGRFFAEARFLLNLDEPLGPSFEEDGDIWGITLLAGGRL
jgi:hypothetical protein